MRLESNEYYFFKNKIVASREWYGVLAQDKFAQRRINWFVNGIGKSVNTISGVVKNIVRAETDWVIYNLGDAVFTFIIYRQAHAVSNRLKKISWLPRTVGKNAIFALEEWDVYYGLQPIIDWTTYEWDGIDLEITCEHAYKLVVLLETWVETGKNIEIFRRDLKMHQVTRPYLKNLILSIMLETPLNFMKPIWNRCNYRREISKRNCWNSL